MYSHDDDVHVAATSCWWTARHFNDCIEHSYLSFCNRSFSCCNSDICSKLKGRSVVLDLLLLLATNKILAQPAYQGVRSRIVSFCFNFLQLHNLSKLSRQAPT